MNDNEIIMELDIGKPSAFLDCWINFVRDIRDGAYKSEVEGKSYEERIVIVSRILKDHFDCEYIPGSGAGSIIDNPGKAKFFSQEGLNWFMLKYS